MVRIAREQKTKPNRKSTVRAQRAGYLLQQCCSYLSTCQMFTDWGGEGLGGHAKDFQDDSPSLQGQDDRRAIDQAGTRVSLKGDTVTKQAQTLSTLRELGWEVTHQGSLPGLSFLYSPNVCSNKNHENAQLTLLSTMPGTEVGFARTISLFPSLT